MTDIHEALNNLKDAMKNCNNHTQALLKFLDGANIMASYLFMQYLQEDDHTNADIILQLKHQISKSMGTANALPNTSITGLYSAVADLLKMGEGIIDDAMKMEESKHDPTTKD